MSAEIKKIEIKINEKTISLNVKEAKELKEILANMFKDPVQIQTIPYPVYIERPYQYWWGTYTSNDCIATYTADSR